LKEKEIINIVETIKAKTDLSNVYRLSPLFLFARRAEHLVPSIVFKIKFLEINLVGCCFSGGFQSTIVNQQSSFL